MSYAKDTIITRTRWLFETILQKFIKYYVIEIRMFLQESSAYVLHYIHMQFHIWGFYIDLMCF